jgi:iron complex outermembrane receptor protein
MAWAPAAFARPDARVPVERTTPPARVEESAPETRPEDPTGFTSVIEVDDYAGEGRRVEDLVERAPGVFVCRFGGPGQSAEISIRGSTASQVVVLLDGVRLNSAQSGTVDLATIPADLVERIEVTRGGGSLQSGSDAIGGVVNIVTRRASAKPTTRVSGSLGSWDTWTASLSQTGTLLGNELLLGYDFFETAGDWEFEPVSGVNPSDPDGVERINNRSEQHAGLLKLARDVGERTRVELSDSFFHGSEGRPGLDLASGGALRGQREQAHQRRTRNAAQLRLRGVEATPLALDWELQGFHRYERSRFRDPEDPPVDSDDVNTALGARGLLEVERRDERLVQRWSLGAEIRRDRFEPKAARKRFRTGVGVSVQNELRLLGERLRIVPALRFDDSQAFDAEWIPRIGAALRLAPWLRIKGNAERSYRVPNFDELFLDEGTLRGDPSLRPEDARNYDLGLELARPAWGPLSALALEVVGFWNDIDNTIVFQQVSPNVIKATNVPDVRSRGLELSAGADYGWLRVSGSYTHLDAELERNGNPLPGRPENEADLRVALADPEGRFKLAGTLLYTDEIPVNASGRSFLSARTTFDASLRLGLHALCHWPARWGLRELAFSVTATNLTDRAVRDALSFPQPGRSLGFLLEARR